MKSTEKIQELKAQLEYVKVQLNKNIKDWEIKEWLKVEEELKLEIKELELHINFYNL